MVSSSDIKIGLRSAFPPPGWQVFYEVADATGARGKRRADAIAMGLWPSNGHEIHGMEIKVSRSDFLNEMKDPTKSQAIFQFCHRWSLVTPPGLVKTSELPETWGLMTYDGKSVRRVKKAPPLTPIPPTPGFMASLLRCGGDADGELVTAAVQKAKAEFQITRERDIKFAIEQHDRQRTFKQKEAEEKLAKYEAIFGDMSSYRIEELGPALKLVNALGIEKTYSGARHLMKTLDESAAKVRGALEQFEKSSFEDILG